MTTRSNWFSTAMDIMQVSKVLTNYLLYGRRVVEA